MLAAARLQCGAAGAGASRGLGVCAEHARLAARGESPRAMEIGDFLVGLGPGGNSQCGLKHEKGLSESRIQNPGSFSGRLEKSWGLRILFPKSGPVLIITTKIHSLSMLKIQLECMILQYSI